MAADVLDVVLKGGICKTNICDNIGSYVTERDILSMVPFECKLGNEIQYLSKVVLRGKECLYIHPR